MLRAMISSGRDRGARRSGHLAVVTRVAAVGALVAMTVVFGRPTDRAFADDQPPAPPPVQQVASDDPVVDKNSTTGTPPLETDSNPQGTGAAAAPPSNDAFSTAFQLNPITSAVTGGTVEATREVGEPTHAGNAGGASIWYKFTANATVSLSIDSSASGFDTLLAVYSGSTLADLVAVAANDDIYSQSTLLRTQSQVFLNVTNGTNYFIAVDGFKGGGAAATGAVSMQMTFGASVFPAPSNDLFANAIAISLPANTLMTAYGSNAAAGFEGGEPTTNSFNPRATVWFKFSVTAAGTVTIDTLNSGFDTLLDMRTGASVGASTAVPGGSNDDADAANLYGASRVSGVAVAAGVTYYVRIAGFAGVQGSYQMHLQFTPTPAAPGAPTGVTAVAGNQQATGSWAAPASSGSSAITGYTVTAAPGGATCTTSSLSCVVAGLTNGTSYTFTARATNAVGPGPSSGASGAVVPTAPPTPPPPAPTGYQSMTPARLLDTRPGSTTVDGQFSGGGAVHGGETLDLPAAGRAGIPASGVDSVVLNVTVADATSSGFVTVFPAGTDRPLASNLNFAPGKSVPNLVIARLGTGGKVSLFNSAGDTNLVVDVVGYFPSGSNYSSLSPQRFLDTRPGTQTVDGQAIGFGLVGPQQTFSLLIGGRGAVPTSGVDSVVLNVTVVEPTSNGYVTVYPSGTQRPTASNLNFSPGQTIPNLVVAKLGPAGTITFFNSEGDSHLVVDVVGWFPTSSGFTSVPPTRLLETRAGLTTIDGQFLGAGPLPGGQVLNLTVAGRAGLPPTGVGAAILNVTVADPTSAGFLTVFPTGTIRPLASNLNFVAGQTVPNLVIAKIGSSGQVSIFNSVGSANVIVDIVGWLPA